MKLELFIQPETNVEQQTITQLAHLRETAIENGMSEQTFARLLMTFGEATLANRSPEADGPEQSPATGCPQCGSPIESVEMKQIGELPTVSPCGCQVRIDALPDDALEQ